MSPSPSEETANQPSPIPSRPTAPPTTTGLFLPPKTPALPPPSPSSSTPPLSPSPEPSPGADAGPISSDDSADAPAPSSERAEPSGTPSTGRRLSVTREGLAQVVGEGVRTLSGLLARFAATPVERDFGLWRPDEDEEKGIAEPVARIAWRRIPPEAKESDVVDLMALGLALIAYVGRNMADKVAIAQKITRGEIQVPAPGDQGAAAP